MRGVNNPGQTASLSYFFSHFFSRMAEKNSGSWMIEFFLSRTKNVNFSTEKVYLRLFSSRLGVTNRECSSIYVRKYVEKKD